LADAQGNPLALLELPVALGDLHRSVLPQVLPLSGRLQAVFAARIKSLPAAAYDQLLLAVLEGTGDLDVLHTDALAPAERARLVRVEQVLVFRHPLIGSAVVDVSTREQRRRAHRLLAVRLADQLERRAWHLAEAAVGPDEEVAALLQFVAHANLWRGDGVRAITLLLRAAELGPGRRPIRRLALTSKIANGWTDHPLADLLILLIVGLHLLVVVVWGHGDVLAWASTGNRLATYAAGAGAMSLIAGFAGTAIAQYGSSSGPIVNAARGRFSRTIRRNWISITSWLLICAILCIVAMSIDGEKANTRGSQWIFEVALAIAVLKFTCLIFLFNLILKMVDVDSNTAPKSKPPAMRDF
ncbi:hypothetical protein JYK22_01970, partial [Nonomuraea sp. RK-328]|nr:hypothetical protein [Nonomuraea sp. RK-328]